MKRGDIKLAQMSFILAQLDKMIREHGGGEDGAEYGGVVYDVAQIAEAGML